MEPKKIVGIWIRVSTEDQAQGDSPEHHEKRARLYAEAKGWDVKVVYHLESVSGKAVMEHPETKKMLKDIKDGTITGLIFSKLARLARNTKELLDFADLFRKCEADLISLQEAIDTSSPAGRLFYTMIAAMAQWEREEIASRVQASVPIRAKLGKNLGGQSVFGYKWENNRLVINETEAPVRKLVYELFLKHKRKKTTANELNKMGYRTRAGTLFTHSAVLRLLRDPTAKGTRRANYTRVDPKSKTWALKPETDWVYTQCPAIVSEDIWEECNQILDSQMLGPRKPGPKAVHLLSGFVNCTCGKKMYVYHTSLVYTCKNCKTRIPVSDLDEIYHDQLKVFLLTDTDLQTYEQKTNTAISEKEVLLRSLTDEVAKLKASMERLVKMRVNDEFTKDAFIAHYKPEEERLGQLRNQLPEIEAEIDFMRMQYLSSDMVLREARNLYERWPTMPMPEKRRVVESITNSITVGKEDLSFDLAYVPSSLNAGNSARDHSVT